MGRLGWLLVWAAWAALAGLLADRVLEDRREPVLCDTTYLWEGYEEVPEAGGGRYRLMAFKDADSGRAACKAGHGHALQQMRRGWECRRSALAASFFCRRHHLPPCLPRTPTAAYAPPAAFQQLQQRHVVPVLFLHGHLGTHQQMRSAAAETGRELARRLAIDADWPLWLQWYAADFASEASALDAGLLVSLVGHVESCRRNNKQALELMAHSPAVRSLIHHVLFAPEPCRTSRPPLCCAASSTCGSCTAVATAAALPTSSRSAPSAWSWWLTAWAAWWHVMSYAAWPPSHLLVGCAGQYSSFLWWSALPV